MFDTKRKINQIDVIFLVRNGQCVSNAELRKIKKWKWII